MRKLAAVIFLALALTWPVYASAAAGFVRTGAMASGRDYFPAETLPDGSVLVASGANLERYDPNSGSFGSAGAMTVNRGTGLTATLLPNGEVLIVGGQSGDTSQSSAEIYDPETGSVDLTGSMSTPRSFHRATLLQDGRVLITGGHEFNFYTSALASAEIYDPFAETFLPTGSMNFPRQSHTATLLLDGRVLITGGFGGALASAELFDPATGTFSQTDSMAFGRGDHTATLLPDGRVLIAGGHSAFPGESRASAEIYDPVDGSFTPTGNMTVPRGGHTATPLPDGTVLVTGGFTDFPCGGTTLASAEIYDLISGGFAPTAAMHGARGRHAAAALPGGEVLVAGGMGPFCAGPLASAEVFSLSVVDTHPPVITVPDDMAVLASVPEGAVVFYNASAIDDVDPEPSVSCEPPSGSVFPLGTTTVGCTAIDDASNTSTAIFHVSVVPALDNVVSLDAAGKVHPETGLATLSGTVSCNRSMNGYLSGELSQSGEETVLQGSFSRAFQCVPPSLAWIASASAAEGAFRPGQAQGTVTVSGCDQLGSCDSDTTSGEVVLGYRQPPPSLITITKIADTSTAMPRIGTNFSFFNPPFVRKGIVAFLGYGEEAQGIYTSSGGALKVVVDTRTPIPGRPGNFFSFDSLTLDGVTLAFQGRDEFFAPGLYTYRAGRITRIADVSTPVPGGVESEFFGDFVGPVLSGGRVAFRGSTDYSSFSSFGVYLADGRTLTAIADRQTPIPGGTGNFGFFGGPPALDGKTVVFPAGGFDPLQEGIFSSTDGELMTLVDRSTPIPGGSGNFFVFGAPVAQFGTVAFLALDESFRRGIYLRTPGGTLNRVVDSSTPVPSRPTTFEQFSDPALDGGIVAFDGLETNFGYGGVYTGTGGNLTTVADFSSPVPEGQGTFMAFGPPALVDGKLAFAGQDSTSTQGLYVHAYGALRKVISVTDTLDGRDTYNLELVTRNSCYGDCHAGFGTGFDGTRVAFLAGFSDGTQGIYLAIVGRPFAYFTAGVELEKQELEMEARFRLGAGSNGISLGHEVMSLQVGTYSLSLPPGSFKSQGDGRYRFKGTIEGVDLRIQLRSRGAGWYDVTFDAEGVDLAGTVNPVTVNLAIGDDAGGISVLVRRKG
jgi:hypothetical protein